MFRGSSPTRVDEKGRLKLPADVKTFELPDSGTEVLTSPATDGKWAQLYPIARVGPEDGRTC